MTWINNLPILNVWNVLFGKSQKMIRYSYSLKSSSTVVLSDCTIKGCPYWRLIQHRSDSLIAICSMMLMRSWASTWDPLPNRWPSTPFQLSELESVTNIFQWKTQWPVWRDQTMVIFIERGDNNWFLKVKRSTKFLWGHRRAHRYGE